MGFLDKVMQQATEVAATVVEKTQETAKVGQTQMQIRTLKGEERDALAAFGREALRLHDEGSLGDVSATGGLNDLATAVHDIRGRLAAKEEELARARETDAAAGETVESDAEEVAEPQADASADDAPSS